MLLFCIQVPNAHWMPTATLKKLWKGSTGLRFQTTRNKLHDPELVCNSYICWEHLCILKPLLIVGRRKVLADFWGVGVGVVISNLLALASSAIHHSCKLHKSGCHMSLNTRTVPGFRDCIYILAILTGSPVSVLWNRIMVTHLQPKDSCGYRKW